PPVKLEEKTFHCLVPIFQFQVTFLEKYQSTIPLAWTICAPGPLSEIFTETPGMKTNLPSQITRSSRAICESLASGKLETRRKTHSRSLQYPPLPLRSLMHKQ